MSLLGCNGSGATDPRELSDKPLSAAAPPASRSTPGDHRLPNDPRQGQLFLPPEAQPIADAAHQAPNPLPSNAREMGAAGVERDARKRAEKAQRPLAAPEAAMVPDAALLAQQQGYLRAWAARQRELDAMDGPARERALFALKQQFLKEGK
jgi:hypothetical protein